MNLTSLCNNILFLAVLISLTWILTFEPKPYDKSKLTFNASISLKEKHKIPIVEEEFASEFTNFEKGPIIGVLTMPCPVIDRIPGHSIIPASYIKWLESAGAIIVPVPFHLSRKKLEVFFKNLNGLVITGGRALLWKEDKEEEKSSEGNDDNDDASDLDNPQDDNVTLPDSNYTTTEQNSTIDITEIETNSTKPKKFQKTRFAKSISHFIKFALKSSRKSDYFPILGICLGMEGIILHFEKNLSNFKYIRKVNLTQRDYIEGVGLFTKQSVKSKLYKHFNGKLKDLTKRVFFYHHQYAIDYDAIVNKFEGGVTPLTYFSDNNKKKYVTSFEFANLPIFGIQFHPEKASYEWRIKMNRSKAAKRVSADMALAFIEECKKNKHQFNQTLFSNLTIYHFNATDYSSIYNQIYKIPFRYHNAMKLYTSKLVINESNVLNETSALNETNLDFNSSKV